MSDVSATSNRGFKPGQSGNPNGRPPKVVTMLRRAHLKLISDLESRALDGDAVARTELFKMIARTR